MPNQLLKPWVVIPTYNELANIAPLVPALFALPIPDLTVLIVDDSSPDGTAQAVKRLQDRFPRLELIVRPRKDGLGRAYVQGFGYALKHGATALVQMDADFSHDPGDVPRLLKNLVNFDLVVGSRYCRGISIINWPLKRLLISIAGNVYARFVTGLPFTDSTGGFRAWRASALRTIDIASVDTDGYGFQITMLFRTWRRGLRIIEVPIIFTERREGKSKMSQKIIREAMLLVWRLRIFGR